MEPYTGEGESKPESIGVVGGGGGGPKIGITCHGKTFLFTTEFKPPSSKISAGSFG